jgi:general secretion pathway protein K
MNRRGFALLAVLWLIAALAALVAGGLALVRTGLGASSNRITLTRAAWAREACIDIMLARGFASARDGSIGVRETRERVDLSRTTWCSLEVADPSGRLNLNLASVDALQRLIGDSLADALLDWRDPDDVSRPLGAESDWYRRQGRFRPRNAPLASFEELRLIRGFDSLRVRQLADLVTVRGRGIINVNAASSRVLAAALQLPDEVISLLNDQRRLMRPVASLDYLISLVPPGHRANLMARYQELTQLLAFGPTELTVTATGGVGESPLLARASVTVVPMPERVAVIRREVE